MCLMSISHPQILLQLSFLISIYRHGEELRGPQGGVTGDHVVRVRGGLHCVLLLSCVDHPQLGLINHLRKTNTSLNILEYFPIC